jgi:hypothetical protein
MIVTVQLTRLPKPSCTPCAVLVDRSPKFLEAFSRRHPRCYVFPFVTKLQYDYSKLENLYVVKPMYVGNLRPMRNAVRQIYGGYISDFGPWKCIHSEVWRCRELTMWHRRG